MLIAWKLMSKCIFIVGFWITINQPENEFFKLKLQSFIGTLKKVLQKHQFISMWNIFYFEEMTYFSSQPLIFFLQFFDVIDGKVSILKTFWHETWMYDFPSSLLYSKIEKYVGSTKEVEIYKKSALVWSTLKVQYHKNFLDLCWMKSGFI